jgi:hypothetical protein
LRGEFNYPKKSAHIKIDHDSRPYAPAEIDQKEDGVSMVIKSCQKIVSKRYEKLLMEVVK